MSIDNENDKLRFFADYIERELGIIYSEQNYFQLKTRLEEIAKSLELPDFDSLLKKAKQGIDGNFKQLLLDVATNNETSFFRDSKVFKGISEFVVPEWLATNASRTFRVWSAASSFGQEPYTLSMCFNELLLKYPTFTWEITATDVSERALARAKAGEYSQLEVQRGLPAPLLVKYFEKSKENYWSAKPSLKKGITFKKQNLLAKFISMGPFDLILCRNVLIYQKVEGKAEIVERVAKLMNPHSYLILGSGESLLGVSESYQLVNKEGIVLYSPKPQQQKSNAA